MVRTVEGFEGLVSKIMEKAALSESEVMDLINKRKEEFGGMLSDEGAAFSVAKDFEIPVETARNLEGKRVTVRESEKGMEGVTMLVRVKRTFQPKTFEKNGKKGKVASVIVEDGSGEARLSLWHKDADKVDSGEVSPGKVLLLRNVSVDLWNDQKQLTVGYNGAIEVNPAEAGELSTSPSPASPVKVSQLKENEKSVSLLLKALKLEGSREFDVQGRKGVVSNVLAADETGTVRVAFWNEASQAVEQLSVGDIFTVSNAYTKNAFKGKIDLNVGPRSAVSVVSFESAPIELQGLKIENKARRLVAELKNSGEVVEVSGLVTQVASARTFDSCAKCQGKFSEGKCAKCGSTESAKRPVISIELEDGSGRIQVNAFGRESEQVHKFSSLEQDFDSLKEEARKALVGKNLVVEGRTKDDAYSQELVIIASKARQADLRKESLSLAEALEKA